MEAVNNSTHFLVSDSNGRRKSYATSEVVAMVLDAARYDGYGAVFDRDSGGAMRLFYTSRHIGNNPMPELDSSHVYSSSECSRLENDAAATLELCGLIAEKGLIHGRWPVECDTISCDELGNVLLVSKSTAADLMEDLDIDQQALNALYGMDAS
jgi:hypothetical protein